MIDEIISSKTASRWVLALLALVAALAIWHNAEQTAPRANLVDTTAGGKCPATETYQWHNDGWRGGDFTLCRAADGSI